MDKNEKDEFIESLATLTDMYDATFHICDVGIEIRIEGVIIFSGDIQSDAGEKLRSYVRD